MFNATGMWRVGGGLRFGAAYTAFSGAPFTRGMAGRYRYFGHAVEESPGVYREVHDSTAYLPGYREAPGAGRFPRFARLDGLVDWSGRIRRVRAGAYLQVHNVLLRRDNPLFLQYGACGTAEGPDGTVSPGTPSQCFDQVQSSFPIAPVLGLRLSF